MGYFKEDQRKDSDTFVFSSNYQRDLMLHRFTAHIYEPLDCNEMGHDLVRIGAVLNHKKKVMVIRNLKISAKRLLRIK